MRNRELPAGNINQVTHGRPVNGYVNGNSTGSQRNPNNNCYTYFDNNLNASMTMPLARQGSQPTPAGSSRPNKAHHTRMHPQMHPPWSMASNSPYQSPHAPGRVGANTPMIARGQAPFNSPYPQRHQGVPQRMMPPGPHENQLPNPRMSQYCQQPLAQPSPDISWDVIRQGQYGQAVQTGNQGTREPRLNITSTRKFHSFQDLFRTVLAKARDRSATQHDSSGHISSDAQCYLSQPSKHLQAAR